jgi:C4-dicarboxylate-specific signal transduction histidine kinase
VGLGLAITADIAKDHGDRLTLSNQQQGGVSACLVLPCVQQWAAKENTAKVMALP